MGDFDYGAYLSSDAWRRKRTRIRKRARGWCERCKVNRRVDVHHLTYERIGHELSGDLIGVCHKCHEFLHGLREYDPAAGRYSEEETRILRSLSDARDIDPDFEMMLMRVHDDWGAVRSKQRLVEESGVDFSR